jgi:hypothetical protein
MYVVFVSQSRSSLEKSNGETLARIKARREKDAEKLEEYVLANGNVIKVAPSRNARRLAVREVVAAAKQKQKRRTLEND